MPRIASLACAFDPVRRLPRAGSCSSASPGLVRRSSTATSTQPLTFTTPSCSTSSASSPSRPTPRCARARRRSLRGNSSSGESCQPQLRAVLEPLALPVFLREFRGGVWGQAIVMASRRDATRPPIRAGCAAPAPTSRKHPAQALDRHHLEAVRCFLPACRPTRVCRLAAGGAGRILRPAGARSTCLLAERGRRAASLITSTTGSPSRGRVQDCCCWSAQEAATELPMEPGATQVEQRSSSRKSSRSASSRKARSTGRATCYWRKVPAPERRRIRRRIRRPRRRAWRPPPSSRVATIPPIAPAAQNAADVGRVTRRAGRARPSSRRGLERDHLQLGFLYQLTCATSGARSVSLTSAAQPLSLRARRQGARDRSTTARTLGRLCAACLFCVRERVPDRSGDAARPRSSSPGRSQGAATPRALFSR